MVRIDGSQGEGGGQVLRSALTLALLTGKAMRIDRIRAARPKPGMMAQHLRAVAAAAAVGGAQVEGAQPGSQSLVFRPQGLYHGNFRFDIGTAGSTSLVLQTILLPLAAACRASTVEITGGTHVPWSPCFHYLELHWLPFLRQMGLSATLHLERAGFYPRGGGAITAAVQPAEGIAPLRLTGRGRLRRIGCLSVVANLDPGIAGRQARQAQVRLAGCGAPVETEELLLPAIGKGTLLLLLAEFEHSRCCYYALGERGKSAERVADEAADQLLAFLATGAAVDEHLADQLLLPLALAGGESEIATCRVTQHLLTNAEVVRQFLPVEIEVEGRLGEPGVVRVAGRGWPGR
jgi:RNA 3'-terminal phosphate cyclase (ATP)